ncbi:MAG: cytochrome P450 [Cyanobacteria bacterium J06634_5]
MDPSKPTQTSLKKSLQTSAEARDRQLKLSKTLSKVGFHTRLGKLLRMKVYYQEGFSLFRSWREFLDSRKEKWGNTFWAFDHALMHTGHADVKKLMQVEPQLRGEDVGIIKILTLGYTLNQPMSLWTNGEAHKSIRTLLEQALPNPLEIAAELGQYTDSFLAEAATRGKLRIGKDLPFFMLKILHHLVLELPLSEKEASSSLFYLVALLLATFPPFISRTLLGLIVGPRIRHRRRLVQRYYTAPKWAILEEHGKQVGLSPEQIANGLFDMIHIAGTAGTGALMGSVIGVLCQDKTLRAKVTEEVNRVWPKAEPLTADSLRQATVLHTVILETARLYPPVRFICQRSPAAGDVEIAGQKCPFAQGTRLLGSVFNANRDEDRYDNPETFSLERDFSDLLSWHGENPERMCPGRDLSIALIKVFCMTLLKHYRWEHSTEVAWNFKMPNLMTPNKLELEGFTSIENAK